MSASTVLARLAPEHAAPLLAFELANREWFRTLVPDRGDAYFRDFAGRHAALLAEQRAGTSLFWLVLDGAGDIVGRVNLVDLAAGGATLGYRIGAAHTRRGHARRAVAEVVRRAARLGLTHLLASTTVDNTGSQKVLAGAGFRPVPGLPPSLPVGDGERPALHFRRDLTPADAGPGPQVEDPVQATSQVRAAASHQRGRLRG
ncbi:GNAT family N-acetyltransferase [Georgenia thermotolerans]|uniref:GNAT family N-acetyltransferase n=1 Tax=Georgenia thermotolerans TaxID=527326 RepID=A0A7J5USY0_9MICO|nr:GNAT family N-acetyltransferase [Georgenia thermotolerans]KAE8765284.1 GNAT family N-acetyltransferase [Georgenia thermotolerans]